jgi:uncharacterized protein YbjT (DUF2867 family)
MAAGMSRMTQARSGPRALLTGATGFVGRHLWPALTEAGWEVTGLTRSAARARERWPERAWTEGDVADADRMREVLRGCDAAFYLVHGMAEGEGDFRARERAAAERFARAAAEARVRRLVYLGGFAPRGEATEHLRSRIEVGEALRGGPVRCVELRASMIIGHGSLPWLIVRDLAARLPMMVLPRWLKSRTQPVAIDDVVAGLVSAAEIEIAGSETFDIPGPEALSGRRILEQTARVMGLAPPLMIEVPVLSPWLSSHWVRFVTRAEWSVAREVVIGLADDFLARDDRYWPLTGRTDLIPFEEAARRALAEEREAGDAAGGAWGAVEQWRLRGARARASA